MRGVARRLRFLVVTVLFVAGCSSGQVGQPKPITPTSAPAAERTTTVTVPSTSTPAPASADQIVLSLDEINALTSEAKYRSGPDLTDAQAPLPAGGPVEPQQCAPALRGLQNASVAGDELVSFRVVESLTVGDPSLPEEKRRKDDFVQVVAVYPSEGAAKDVFAMLTAGVVACRDQKAVEAEPGESAKTEYTVKAGERSQAKLRWSQHQTGWGTGQQCVLEARIVRNVVLQDIECGVGTEKAPVGQLLSQVLDKAAGRVI